MRKGVIRSIFLLFLMLFLALMTNIRVYASESTNDINLDMYYQDSETIYDMSNLNSIHPLTNNGIRCTISNYDDQFHGINIGGNRRLYSSVINGDDPITNIIPKSYFTHVNSSFVSGNAYSFYINTQRDNVYLDANIYGISREALRSEVLIIDKENNFNNYQINEIEDRLSIGFRIHQFIFYTVDTTLDELYLPGAYYICNSISSNYSSDEVVIPVPVQGDSCYRFAEACVFRVSDLWSNMKLKNHHYTDENDGVYLTGVCPEYEANKSLTVSGKLDVDGLVNTFGGIMLTLAGFVEKGTLYAPGISLVVAGLQTLQYFQEASDVYYFVEGTSNVQQIAEIKRISSIKSVQMQRFGALVKDYKYGLPAQMLINKENYVRYDYSFSAADDELYSTQIDSTLGYGIYLNGELVMSVEDKNTYNIYGNDTKDIYINFGIDNEYNIKGTSQKYEFTPLYTQGYQVCVSEGNEFTVIDNYNNVITSTNGVYSFVGGRTYTIEVSSNEDSYYSIKVKYLDIIDAEITLEQYGSYYFNFNPTSSGVYTFTTELNRHLYIIKINDMPKDIAYFECDNDYVIFYKHDVERYNNGPLIPIVEVPQEEGTTYRQRIITESGDYDVSEASNSYLLHDNHFSECSSGLMRFSDGDILYSKNVAFTYIKRTYEYKVILDGECVYYNQTIDFYGTIIPESIELVKAYDEDYYKKVDIISIISKAQDNSIVDFRFNRGIINVVITYFDENDISCEFKFCLGAISNDIINVDTSIQGENIYIFARILNSSDYNASLKLNSSHIMQLSKIISNPLCNSDGTYHYEFRISLQSFMRELYDIWVRSQELSLEYEFVRGNISGDSNPSIKTSAEIIMNIINSNEFILNNMRTIGRILPNYYLDNHLDYIVSTINIVNGYYQIENELQFLAMFYLNEAIDVDDGINYEPYTEYHFYLYMRLLTNLYFENEFHLPHISIFYGIIDGNNFYIYDLLINHTTLYSVNNGYVCNISFINASFYRIFHANGSGSTTNIWFYVEEDD